MPILLKQTNKKLSQQVWDFLCEKLMSNDKEWYKKIPQQGVLCVCNKDIIAVIYDYKEDIDCPFVSIGQRFSSARPLNFDEWWQFAPWQPMETAPKNGEVFLLKDKNGNVHSCYESEFGFEYDGITTDDEADFLGWLPLPKTGE